jgi:hypothetical protein
MIGYLTILAIFALMTAIGVMLKSRSQESISKYVISGLLIMIIAFIIEYFGTATEAWTYSSSLFMLNLGAASIPIESLLLFFSIGILGRFFIANMKDFDLPISYNVILYILLLVVLVPIILGLSEGTFPDMLPLAAIIGLWGVMNASADNRKNIILLSALFIAADWIIETTIISRGGYSFSTGFTISTAITHGMFALGFLTAIDKLKDITLNIPVSLPKTAVRQWSTATKPKAPVGSRGPARVGSPVRSILIIIGIVGAASVAILYITGVINPTGLFSSSAQTTTTTTIENVTTTTSTTTTTTSTTTTTTTTLPPCTGNYCIYLNKLTCSGRIIVANLTNSGPKTITAIELSYFKFLVNGNETSIFICTPTAALPGDTIKCSYPASDAGTYDIEIRGLSFGNIETGSVYCS